MSSSWPFSPASMTRCLTFVTGLIVIVMTVSSSVPNTVADALNRPILLQVKQEASDTENSSSGQLTRACYQNFFINICTNLENIRYRSFCSSWRGVCCCPLPHGRFPHSTPSDSFNFHYFCNESSGGSPLLSDSSRAVSAAGDWLPTANDDSVHRLLEQCRTFLQNENHGKTYENGSKRIKREKKVSYQEKVQKVSKLLKKMECKAVLTNVEVPKEKGEEHLYFHPCMVRVKRCSGCCGSDEMQCVPTKRSTKHFWFKVESKNDPSGYENKFVRKKVDSHDACDCRCKVLSEDCKNSAVYNQTNCSCDCPLHSCPSGQVLVPKECQCKCARKSRCSSGTEWDPSKCSCVRYWKI